MLPTFGFNCTDIKYNHEKEEKIKQSKKQQELSAIEEAIKYAEESKNKSKMKVNILQSLIMENCFHLS